MTFKELLARDQIKPRRHPADEEHRMQCACVRWFRAQYPHLEHNLFAVPNGGRRDKVTAARLKSEGVKAGVSDLILLKPNIHYHALLIEMKTQKGVLSQLQKAWRKLIEPDGYKYVVCRSLEDFMEAINGYLNNE